MRLEKPIRGLTPNVISVQFDVGFCAPADEARQRGQRHFPETMQRHFMQFVEGHIHPAREEALHPHVAAHEVTHQISYGSVFT